MAASVLQSISEIDKWNHFLKEEMKQKNDIIENVLKMKQVQIENSSSINAIKLRQDIKKCNIKFYFREHFGVNVN